MSKTIAAGDVVYRVFYQLETGLKVKECKVLQAGSKEVRIKRGDSSERLPRGFVEASMITRVTAIQHFLANHEKSADRLREQLAITEQAIIAAQVALKTEETT